MPSCTFQCTDAMFEKKVEEWVEPLVDRPDPSENGGMVKDG